MAFELVYGGRGLALALPFEQHVEARLIQLLDGSAESAGDQTLGALASEIAEAITALIENSTLPPSEKQIRYAVAIAQELSLELPADVLRFKPSMAAFLGAHAPRYRSAKGR